MKIGILGTGIVGETIGRRLVELGHEVRVGSRSANNEKASAWAKAVGAKGSHGTFEAAASFGEVVFNCVKGAATLAALSAATAKSFENKVLIDTSNPLDASKGMPPGLFVSSFDSLGEMIQREFPKARVVKALNTMSCNVMVNPRVLTETTAVFLAGEDPEAKDAVRELLSQFGWLPEEFVDLGGIAGARGAEASVLLWVRLWGAKKTGTFNLKIVDAKAP